VKLIFYFFFPIFAVGAIYFIGTVVIENFLNLVIGIVLGGLAFLTLAILDKRQENDY
jgi:hypothetical protein